MKFNWKVLAAIVVIFAVVLWAVDSLRDRSYADTGLTFDVGRGAVVVTNPSDEIVTAQLVAPSSRSFTVASPDDNLAGSSARDASGDTRNYVFDLMLPPGVSTFTLTRGTGVSFVGADDARLSAVIESTSAGDRQTTLIVTGLVILAGLFFISQTTRHQWIKSLRSKQPEPQNLTPVVEAATAHSQGAAIRSYGDNRSDTSAS